MKLNKLNNKGYLIVEIIISVTLAMTIAYFLIDLTVKLKDAYEDTQIDAVLMTSKTIMTNEILGDLYKKNITSVEGVCNKDTEKIGDCIGTGKNGVGLIFTLDEGNQVAVRINKEEKDEPFKLEYGKCSNCNQELLSFDKEGNNYSVYTFDSRITLANGGIENPGVESNETPNNVATLVIPLETLYSKKDYGISIIIPY